jgi:tripeptide aminopeptidase
LILHQFSPESIPSGGDTANILIRIPGTGQGASILLTAHLDTVPPGDDYSIVLEDGILRTEGDSVLGGDDRAGVAAALEMIDIGLMFPDKHAGLEILFIVQEELGALGSRDLDRTVIKANFGYNLDGETPPGSIIVSAPRKAKYKCEIFGQSSHAALDPEKGISAIKIAGSIIMDLPQGQIDQDTTANIGSISGGGQINIVPDYVRITGEIRSFTSGGYKKVCEDVERLVSIKTVDFGGRASLSWEHTYYGYSVDPTGPCVSRFTQACEKFGIKPRLLTSPGGGDSNNLNALGIENVVFGLGMHEIHTPNEYMVIDEYYTAVQILKEVVIL